MIPARSDVLDVEEEEDQNSPGRPLPSMVSLHFVRSALRRRWLVCAASALLGLFMAIAFLVTSPAAHEAKATLILAHEPQSDPSRAMATDVSLLKTRTVADRTIASLGLTMTPDEFLSSVTVVPVSSELMSLTLTAPSDAEAVRRLTALTSIYLQFRGEQLSTQSNALVAGMQQRIDKLQGDVSSLTRRIEQLSAAGGSDVGKLSDTISQRAYAQGRIETLQQSVEDATLQNTAVLSSSGVLDPAASELGGLRRRIALALASGLIGGAALGCGTVLFLAIISDRLRRRSDVAAALDVPVPVSVGRIAPLPKRWLRFAYMRAVDGRRADGRQRLARAIEMELPVPRQSGRLAVVCLNNADEVRFAVAAAAMDLLAAKRSVDLIDLTEHGSLKAEFAASTTGSTHRPTVLRPRGIPALAGGAADLRAVDHEDWNPDSLELTDVTLIVADLDPSVGIDHLTAWTDRVIIAVTAGRSSVELVRTTADLVRTAGLEFRFAVLLRTERTDDSSGTAGFDRPATIHLLAGYDRAVWAAESIDEEQTTAEETLAEAPALAVQEEAAQEQPAAEDQIGEQPVDEELAAAVFEETIAEEQLPEQLVDDEQIADQEEATAEEQYAEEEQAAAVEDGTIAEEQLPEQLVDDEQAADQEEATAEEQYAEEQPGDEEQAAAVEDETIAAEQLTEQLADDEQAADQEEATAEEQYAEVQPGDEEQAAAVEDETIAAEQLTEQLADDEQAADQEETAAAAAEEQYAEEQPADLEQATTEEQPEDDEQAAAVLDETIAEEQDAEEQQAAAVLDEDTTEEQDAEEQLVALEQATTEEQPEDDEPVAEEQAAAVLDQAIPEEQLQEQPAEVPHAPDEQEAPAAVVGAIRGSAWRRHLHRRHRRRGKQGDNLPVDSITIVDPASTLPIDRIAAAEEAVAEEQPAAEDATDHEEIAAGDTADETELVAERDQVPNPAWDETAVDGWELYADAYPPAYLSAPRSEDDELDELNWNWDWDLDDADSKQDFAVIGADNEVQVVDEQGLVQQVTSESDTRDAADLAGNGQESNGQGHHADEAHTGIKL